MLKLASFIFSQVTITSTLYALPIKRVWRVLFVLGFVPLVGYPVISEDYSFGMMLFVLSLVGLLRRWNPWVRLVLAMCLANTHLLFLILSAPFVYFLLTEPAGWKSRVENIWRIRLTFLAGLIYAISVLFSLYLILPNSESPIQPELEVDLTANLRHSVEVISKSLVPSLWSSDLPSQIPRMISVGSILFVGFLGIAMRRVSPRLLFPFLLTLITLLGNMVFGYGVYWWHYGAVFLCFFMILAIMDADAEVSDAPSRWHFQTHRALFSVLLISQIIAIPIGPGRDFVTSRPYSNALGAARVINEFCSSSCTPIGTDSQLGVAVSAFLQSGEVFWVDRNSYGTFIEWGSFDQEKGDWDSWIEAMSRFESPILFTLPQTSYPRTVVRIGALRGAVWADEDFDIFVLSK